MIATASTMSLVSRGTSSKYLILANSVVIMCHLCWVRSLDTFVSQQRVSRQEQHCPKSSSWRASKEWIDVCACCHRRRRLASYSARHWLRPIRRWSSWHSMHRLLQQPKAALPHPGTAQRGVAQEARAFCRASLDRCDIVSLLCGQTEHTRCNKHRDITMTVVEGQRVPNENTCCLTRLSVIPRTDMTAACPAPVNTMPLISSRPLGLACGFDV